MKKFSQNVLLLICWVGTIVVWFIGQEVHNSDLKWYDWNIKDLFNYYGEHINQLGTAVIIIAVVIALILVDNYRLHKRIQELENRTMNQVKKDDILGNKVY